MKTICGFCHASCGMIVKVKDGVVTEVKGDPDHPVNQGILCPKGIAAIEFIYAKDRLTHPLLKTRGGFKKISWNDAVDIAANQLGDLREKYGPGTLIRYAGSPIDYECRDGFRQLLAFFGSPNSTAPANLCSIPRYVAMKSVSGEILEPDYKDARLVIFWGANPMGSCRYGHYSLEGEFGNFRSLIPEARRRGIKIITIDPVYSETAKISDTWISLEPDSDSALALAMIHVIIKENLYDEVFVRKWTKGLDCLQEHVKNLTPEWAETITGVSAEVICEVSREYATAGRAAIRDGNGLDMHTNGVQTVRAIMFLVALTGNYDSVGGNVILPWVRQSELPILQGKNEKREKRLGEDQFPLFPEIPSPAIMDALLQGDTPRGMIVHHSNPVLVMADTRKVKQAFAKLKFLMVFDVFPTATAQMADLILPSTSPFERFGYRAYSNRQGGFLSLRQKVIEPVGECRSFAEVEYEIARKLGFAKSYPFTNNQEWVDFMLRPSGLGIDDLREKSVVIATPPVEYQKYLKSGFRTPSQKIEFYSDTLARNNYAPLPTYQEPLVLKGWKEDRKARYPLKGTTRKPYEYVLTNFHNLNSLQKIYPAPLAMLHPEDTAGTSIRDGSTIAIESPNGRINVRAKLTCDVRRGLVIVDFGWGNPSDPSEGANTLTSSEVWDPISGGTPNRLFICDVHALDIPDG